MARDHGARPAIPVVPAGRRVRGRAFDPPRLFEYTWEDEVLRWELRPDGEEGCILVFTDTIDDRDRAARNASGWHACLDALEELLAG